MIPVFDSNIVIDCLRGIEAGQQEFNHFAQRSISIMTWIEVMSGVKHTPAESNVRGFLEDNFDCIELEPVIAERACSIRKQVRLKLPDAIIWATAQARQALLVTRNYKDFPEGEPSIRIPYRLD